MYGLKDPEEILEETKNRLGRIPTVPEVTTKDLEELDELKKLQKKLSAFRKKDIVAKVYVSIVSVSLRKTTVHRWI
ncbi:hypothetical protein ARMGADRAFT_1013611 [Armillaria gallica]|uniref:Uncharacterized protein n=1 Tax=Armillaria gallica TaxID=47427 RepID=A0A2H3DCH3_ARMGA|nr:hypothetical protein ARMGADRAFT_1013611 [Armillaria gallica]